MTAQSGVVTNAVWTSPPDMCEVTTVDIVTTYDPETMTDVTGPDSSTEMMQMYSGTDAVT